MSALAILKSTSLSVDPRVTFYNENFEFGRALLPDDLRFYNLL